MSQNLSSAAVMIGALRVKTKKLSQNIVYCISVWHFGAQKNYQGSKKVTYIKFVNSFSDSHRAGFREMAILYLVFLLKKNHNFGWKGSLWLKLFLTTFSNRESQVSI